MSLVTRAASALGIASAGRALFCALGLALIAGLSGVYVGKQWQVGVEARTNLRELNEVIDAHRQQTERLRVIADEFAQAREDQRQFHDAQRLRLLDWMLAPGPADDARIGADGLRLWNDANAGVGSRSAAAGPVDAVRPTRTGDERPGQAAGGQPRGGHDALRRLRDQAGRTGRVGTGSDDAGD